MSNRTRWQTAESFDIPFMPLLDIIFILIIFFLVATTFYSEERDLEIKLPEGTEGSVIKDRDSVFVINVREKGVIVVNEDILTLSQLSQRLEEVRREGRRVEIRGDTNARHGRIMVIMNLCKRSGISDYALTQRIVQTIE